MSTGLCARSRREPEAGREVDRKNGDRHLQPDTARLQSLQASGAVRPVNGAGLLKVDRLAGVGSAGIVDAVYAKSERLVRGVPKLRQVQVDRGQEQDEAKEPVAQPVAQKARPKPDRGAPVRAHETRVAR